MARWWGEGRGLSGLRPNILWRAVPVLKDGVAAGTRQATSI